MLDLFNEPSKAPRDDVLLPWMLPNTPKDLEKRNEARVLEEHF